MNWIDLKQSEITSAALGNTRTIWVQPPAARPRGVLILLDAEYYLAHVRVAKTVARLQREGAVPPLLTAYVSHVDFKVRWPETFCNPLLPEFLADELLPWLGAEFGPVGSGPNVVAGLSLTGLAAAHAAILRPESFPLALCQAGSFWWEDGRFIDEVADREKADVRFSISVGTAETDEDVDHGDGLFQRESQLASNRRMREALVAKGYSVAYREYDGGHDVKSWEGDFPAALTALFHPNP